MRTVVGPAGGEKNGREAKPEKKKWLGGRACLNCRFIVKPRTFRTRVGESTWSKTGGGEKCTAVVGLVCAYRYILTSWRCRFAAKTGRKGTIGTHFRAKGKISPFTHHPNNCSCFTYNTPQSPNGDRDKRSGGNNRYGRTGGHPTWTRSKTTTVKRNVTLEDARTYVCILRSKCVTQAKIPARDFSRCRLQVRIIIPWFYIHGRVSKRFPSGDEPQAPSHTRTGWAFAAGKLEKLLKNLHHDHVQKIFKIGCPG